MSSPPFMRFPKSAVFLGHQCRFLVECLLLSTATHSNLPWTLGLLRSMRNGEWMSTVAPPSVFLAWVPSYMYSLFIKLLFLLHLRFKLLLLRLVWLHRVSKVANRILKFIFSMLPSAAQSAQRCMFQNVAYRPTVYKTGHGSHALLTASKQAS